MGLPRQTIALLDAAREVVRDKIAEMVLLLTETHLDWDEVRASPDPHATALEFARSAFRHACAVCAWDPGLAASADGIPPPVT